MLRLILAVLALAPLSALAAEPVPAENACVPADSILCTIDRLSENNCDVYTLSTTFQRVSTFNVDAAQNCSNSIDAAIAKTTLARLVAEGQQLVQAGACRIVINNVQ